MNLTITSSSHLESSNISEDVLVPHTVFTYGLTQGVSLSSSMPCNTNRDGIASMRELVSYIGSFVDPWVKSTFCFRQNKKMLAFC